MSYFDIFFIAITMGLLGAVHCISMCGPLMLGTFPRTIRSHPLDFFLYHTGKTIAYMTIGLGVGIIGSSVHIFLSQQKLSILSGVILLIYFLFSSFRTTLFSKWSPYTFLHNRFKKIDILPLPRYYLLGFLNGFLPCGLVYIAAVSSASTGHISKSIFWMFCFGVGTIPSSALILWLSGMIHKGRLQILLRYLYQYLPLILSILLILRGLNLDIPYISPKIEDGTEVVKSCHG